MSRHTYTRGEHVLVRARVYSGDQEYEDVLHLVTEGTRKTFPVKLTDLERQRSRLPDALVERIKRSSIGTECPTWARYLLRDILAEVEGKE